MTRADASQDYLQPPGLSFSEASIALAKAAPLACPGGRAADLGCGCGVVGLEALAQGRLKGLAAMHFVERQWVFHPALAANLALAAKTREPRLYWLMTDWRDLSPARLGGRLDLVLCNPPWREPSLRGSPNLARRAAREELNGELSELLAVVSRLLRPGGLLALAWPGQGQERLVAAMAKAHRLKLSRLVSSQRRSFRLLLAEFISQPS